MTLSSTELADLERDGYLVLEGFTPADACEELARRAVWLLHRHQPETVSIFRAHDGSLNSDAYFLDSGDKIRCFFEEHAGDRPLEQAINKLGHALHDLDDTFDRFSRAPEVCALVAGLGLGEPLALQSMYIFKQPHIGGEVTYHQDATYLYTRPSSVIGLWWAIEDATLDNGCLWVWPGGHALGQTSRLVRADDDTTRYDVYQEVTWPRERFIPLEVARGTLVLLHGHLPHGSGANLSARSRHAYSLHIIDGTCEYPADNWLRRGPDLPLRGFRHAG